MLKLPMRIDSLYISGSFLFFFCCGSINCDFWAYGCTAHDLQTGISNYRSGARTYFLIVCSDGWLGGRTH